MPQVLHLGRRVGPCGLCDACAEQRCTPLQSTTAPLQLKKHTCPPCTSTRHRCATQHHQLTIPAAAAFGLPDHTCRSFRRCARTGLQRHAPDFCWHSSAGRHRVQGRAHQWQQLLVEGEGALGDAGVQEQHPGGEAQEPARLAYGLATERGYARAARAAVQRHRPLLLGGEATALGTACSRQKLARYPGCTTFQQGLGCCTSAGTARFGKLTQKGGSMKELQ